MRSSFRTCMAALLATLALGAVAATAAQATEGPFYKVGGSRLLSGESKELKSTLTEEFVIFNPTVLNVRCTKQKLGAGSELLGSTGANGASSKETLVFEHCIVEGNGAECELEHESLTTTTLNMLSAYANKERTGKVLELFKPASGRLFATLKFVGKSCKFEKTTFEGAMAAELRIGGKAVEVGKEPAAAVASELNFPTTLIKSVWTESGGVLTEQKFVLSENGRNFSKITGTLELTLIGEPKWGAFTS
jgi:hypothetical protein